MNEEFFTETVRRMTPDLYRVAVSILWNDADATDAMQDAILRAWEKRDRLREADKLPAWLMRILVNQWKSICQGVFYLISKKEWYNNKRAAPQQIVSERL